MQVPNTALVVTIDVSDRFDVHPAQKTVVGQRLAYAAERVAYGRTAPVTAEPMLVKRVGPDLVVNFKPASIKLQPYSSDAALGFEACEGDGSCYFVTGVPRMDTPGNEQADDHKNTLRVVGRTVRKPVHFRRHSLPAIRDRRSFDLRKLRAAERLNSNEDKMQPMPPGSRSKQVRRLPTSINEAI